ncbi:MAG: S1/P1 nuclease [Colwellia sp.]|nr:S1/P1 nuclease [Colwellia sp.]MCW8864703.1 S1/P1 nuclease [Colwellia sp.]MCW9081926.1 S1/P1 nuclease [Colwellia sp.]
MKTFFLSLTLSMSLLLISPASFALGKLGHQVVCQLAFDHLSRHAQNKLTQLLTSIPKNHQDLINHYNYRKKGTAISFAHACTWADAVKRVEKFRTYSSWHYMNVPRSETSIKANACRQDCLPQAILHHQKLLSQKTAQSAWQQSQALFFLGHWLGDIHQPLHISFASDLGGNQVKLTHLSTKCSNLHWYWDECILYRGKHTKDKWLQLLTAQWRQAPAENGNVSQVWQWADESFQLVRAASFNYCQVDSQGTCHQSKQEVQLPEGYMEQYQQVLEQRLLLAAKRLTGVLEASL